MSQPTGYAVSSIKAKSLSGKRPTPTQGVVMDGVIYKSASQRSEQQSADPNRPVAQKVHWQPSRSMALMREAVTAPKRLPRIKSDIKRNSKSPDSTARFGLKFKPDPEKTKRAKMIERSSKVSRFGISTLSIAKTNLAPTVTKISGSVRAVSQPQSTSSSTAAHAPAAAMALAHPVPSMPNISHQKLEAMLDRALAQADAHQEILRGRLSLWRRIGRSKAILLTVGVILALVAAMFAAYLRVPSFSAKVASVASGVDAHAPTYIPPGYSLSSTSFKNGTVTMKFTNGGESFVISQQKSGLNEEALRSSVVVPASKLYQASQYNGVTVYTYGNTAAGQQAGELNAALVNQGVKTTVTNQAGLDNEQLSKIVQGLL